MRRLLCLLSLSLLLTSCSHYSKGRKQSATSLATTAEQKALSKSVKSLGKYPLAKMGLYLDSANSARIKLSKNPGNASAQSDYNFAIARIVEIIQEEKLRPWDTSLICASGNADKWTLSLKPQNQRQKENLSHYEITPADLYEFKGKLVGEHKLKKGLGAPVVAVAKNVNFKKVTTLPENGKLRFYGLTAVIRFQGRKCELSLIDPLSKENVTLDGHNYPLAADFQAPISMALSKLNVKKMELSGMLSPTKHEGEARLAILQPYDPGKIPVLFIHGLGNSAGTWAPMIEHLRNSAAIRKRYQFWIFNYPTGLPYPASATALKTQLDELRKLHPKHKDIVIVAHSLGGNLSRLLITDSGMKLWNMFYDKPPAEIPFSDETRKLMSGMLIFKARPDISRVIFASASLGGSNDATNFTGRLGIKLIGNPFAKDLITKEAIEYARPELRASGKKHLPNSVEILNPENKFLQAVNALPIKPGIPYHTLIGNRGKGGNLDHTEPISTDGIVPYWSSHMNGALSEKVIPSEHWSILHPMGMAEVERILLKY